MATPEIKLADVEHNANAIISAANAAGKKGVKLLVLPELCLTGYTCGDLFYQQTLLDAAERFSKEVAQNAKESGILLFFGAPIRREGKIYNCAVCCYGGKILAVVPKTFLPNYNEFYEKRHFSPAPKENSTVKICGEEYPFGTGYIFENELMPAMRVGVEICEDLWASEPPSNRLARGGATIIVNLSCSDETIGKAEYRRNLIKMQSAKTFSAYLYANAGDGESSTDTVYSGHSIICDNGRILAETELFKNTLIYSEVDTDLLEYERSKLSNYDLPPLHAERIKFGMPVGRTELTRIYDPAPFVPAGEELEKRAELILNMQAQGLKTRIKHIGAKNVVLGISGGLDSTLALLVCARAFDTLKLSRKGVIAVTMPCFGTTTRTFTNAVELPKLLGCTLKTVDIKESVLKHFADIGHDPKVTDVTYENAQARERTQVLMDIANGCGGIVVGTGDLSELALGWATYNGDHMSMYGVNASVPKTLIKFLIMHEAKTLGGKIGKVLEDILDTPVSPELLPHRDDEIVQKTEDAVGPYSIHDFVLFHTLRNGFKPSKIYSLAIKSFDGKFAPDEILKWMKVFYRRFFSQQFKRSCLPDGVKIGSVTLSPRGDWRMPSDATARLWLDDLEKIQGDQ